jgi:hypothetical protein
MITTGQNPRIEYEHTRSKIKEVHDGDVVTCMAVASGTVSFIEQFFTNLDSRLSETDPTGIDHIAKEARKAYTEAGRNTVENQVLDKFGLEISDLTQGNTDFESDVLSSFLSDVSDAQDNFSQQLEVVLGGVDALGPRIYSIQNFDLDPQNTIGYHTIGSGTQPARSVFIRNEYDTDCDIDQGIISTIEAKKQAEEARGVGTEMDLAVINRAQDDSECCELFDRQKKAKWESLYNDIIEAEKEARQETINTESLQYEVGDQGQ